jgi:hypothetical protein
VVAILPAHHVVIVVRHKMTKNISQYLAREAIYALLDVLDGEQVHDIVGMTGLSQERCEKIASIRAECFATYGKEWLDSK